MNYQMINSQSVKVSFQETSNWTLLSMFFSIPILAPLRKEVAGGGTAGQETLMDSGHVLKNTSCGGKISGSLVILNEQIMHEIYM